MEKLLLLMFILGSMPCSSVCRTKNLTAGCHPEERDALQKFKTSLLDSSRRLSSWTAATDCCKYWKGVSCNATTGHVVKLDLGNRQQQEMMNSTSRGGNDSIPIIRGSNVNPSLLGLRYLNYLDLSGNDFQGTSIPEFLGSMKKLRFLNLSYAGFGGMIPIHLGNLSSLVVLDLSNYGGDLATDDFMWISRLSSLQHFDLIGVDLGHPSTGGNLLEVLNFLPSLVKVRLSNCQLTNYQLSSTHLNSSLSNLRFLDLSSNYLEGEIPKSLLNMTSLQTLDLSFNGFNSSLAALLGLKNLVNLNLANNKFDYVQSGFPMFLWNNCHLETLDLSQNEFQGELLSINGNISGCMRYSLVTLSLSGNLFTGFLPEKIEQFRLLKSLDLSGNIRLTGPIPASLGKLSKLEKLDLSLNQLSGTIPPSLGNLTSLKLLALHDNRLTGTIPISFGKLSNLEKLDLSFNILTGVISEAHFSEMRALKELTIGDNILAFRVHSSWEPPFQLQQISMESCKLESTSFPHWLRTQKEIVKLYLSNTSISETLPEWLHYMKLEELDLSNNFISGALPRNISDMMPRLTSLLLDGNRLNGAIPNSFCRITTLQVLDLSRNSLFGNIPNCWNDAQGLEILKLSSNKLSGNIPTSIGSISSLQALDLSKNILTGNVPNIWYSVPELAVLKLSSNRLLGTIPKSIGRINALQWLHLNNNSLTGEIPSTLRNCSRLVVLDVGDNKLTGEIPKWIGNDLQEIRALRLHQNIFSGRIPSELCQLLQLQVMDLGHNHLRGSIPPCFGNFTGMVVMEEFTDSEGFAIDAQWEDESMLLVLRGLEEEFTKTLVFAVLLDLSNNNLSGEIPEELTNLSGLIGLDLSNNYLSGRIPGSIGNMKSLESVDLSKNELSAEIPQAMSDLKFLSHLNLSYNNFSGEIPTGPQLRTLNDPSIYAGNPGLCGPPLTKECKPDHEPRIHSSTGEDQETEDGDQDSSEEKVVFYGFVIAGFATGFWGILGTLVLKESWRHAFFSFLDSVKERILLEIALWLSRRRR